MVDNHDPAIPDELIDECLQFLRGGGPAPDRGDLGDELSGAAASVLAVMEALVNAAPAPPPLEHDPVAIRLGLVGIPSGPPGQATANRDDPITAAVADIEHRFSVSCSPAATDGTAFERRFECRSVVEKVLVVVVPDGTSRTAMSAHARSAFALADDLSAVVYTTATGGDSVVLTYAECHRMLDPASGWTEASNGPNGESLEIALGRYLERSDPKWGEIQGLEMSGVLGGIDADVVATVEEVKRQLASAKPRLEHKKEARVFALGCADVVFIDWARRVQRGSLSGDGLLGELRSLIEAGS